jgi:hypothetical protein
MSLQFAAALPSQKRDVSKFLREVFGANPQTNSFQPQVLDWKYFSPHPAWSQPRSFLLQKDQEIVGHGGVWPIRLATGGEGTQAIHLVDWAASPAALGAGVHVLRSIAQMADVMITIGGSPDTRKILPKLGYKKGGVLRRYARVVRPWLQMRTRTRQDWKTPLRFLRNASAAWRPLLRIPSTWRIEPVAHFGEEVEPALARQSSSQEISPLRTIRGLNYVLACPAAEFSGFVVRDSARLVGYFILANVGHQSRIVDFSVASDHPHALPMLCAAAARTAAADRRVAEIIAGASSEKGQNPWQQLGFRPRRQDPILYLDRRKLLSSETILHLNLVDGDLAFMYSPDQPYIS